MYYSISVMAKKKIFDVVFVFNEYDLIQERINLFKNEVEKFVIYDFGDGCKNLSNDKVIHIKTPLSFLNDDFDLIYETIKILDRNKIYVEDILLFSKAHEIPNFEVIKSESETLDKLPVFFRQKKVFWNTNFVSPKINVSAFALKYSHYLSEKKLCYEMFHPKEPLTINYITLDCGWQFNGFQNKSDLQKSIKFWYGKEFTEIELENLHQNLLDFDYNQLVTANVDASIDFGKFSTKTKVRELKKILITTDNISFNSYQGEAVLIEKNRIITNNSITYDFVIPSIEYYQDEDFELSYSKNEVFAVLKKLNLFQEDVITIQKKETLEEVNFTYQEFLNVIPSDFI